MWPLLESSWYVHARGTSCVLVCVCEFDLKVLHFLMLSSSAHYPNSGWTHSKVRAVRRWPTFSFCQRPSFSYPPSARSQVYPARSSYKIRKKLWHSHRCIIFKRVMADGIRYSELCFSTERWLSFPYPFFLRPSCILFTEINLWIHLFESCQPNLPFSSSLIS